MRRPVIALLWPILALGTSVFGQSPRDEARALAVKFSSGSIYFAGEAVLPYHERVSFKVFRPGDSDLDGHFMKDYLSSSQWRERSDLGDFVRITVRNGDQRGDFRSAAFEPFRLLQLRDVVPPVVIAYGDQETVKKIVDRSVHGVQARCVVHERPLHGRIDEEDSCFEATTGMLLSWQHHVGGGVCSITCGDREDEWFDYTPYHDRLYPRRLVVKFHGHPIIEASIEFTPGDDLKPTAFAIPQSFEVRKACQQTSAPVRVKGELPPFPHRIGQSGFEGTLMLQARIGVDGRVQEAHVITNPYSSSPTAGSYRARRDIDDVLEDAVRKWQFEPARCDGAPMVDNVIFPVTTEVR